MRGTDSTSGTLLQGTRSCAEVKKRLDVLVAQREVGEGSQEQDQSSVAATQARKKFGRKMSKKRNGGSTVRWRRELAKGGEEDKVRGLVVTAFRSPLSDTSEVVQPPAYVWSRWEKLLTRAMAAELGGISSDVFAVPSVHMRKRGCVWRVVRVFARRQLLREVLQVHGVRGRQVLEPLQRGGGLQLSQGAVPNTRVPMLCRAARVRPGQMQALHADSGHCEQAQNREFEYANIPLAWIHVRLACMPKLHAPASTNEIEGR